MSAKSVAQKLLIKPDTAMWSSHPSHAELLGPLPEGVRWVDGPRQAQVAVVLAENSASLRDILEAHKDHLAQPKIFWVAYPKANRTDINRDSLWPILAEYGLRPISQVAVDEVWSALRFRPLQEGEKPFTGGRS